MSFKCAHCGGRHNKSEAAQACAERARARKAVPETAILFPSGYYLIDMVSDAGTPFKAIIEVRQLSGQWYGRYLVNVHDAYHNGTAVPSPSDRDFLIGAIKSFGFRRALKEYGRTMKVCPICQNSLLDEREQESGVHKNLACSSEVFG
jgi:hypothetical protein